MYLTNLQAMIGITGVLILVVLILGYIGLKYFCSNLQIRFDHLVTKVDNLSISNAAVLNIVTRLNNESDIHKIIDTMKAGCTNCSTENPDKQKL